MKLVRDLSVEARSWPQATHRGRIAWYTVHRLWAHEELCRSCPVAKTATMNVSEAEHRGRCSTITTFTHAQSLTERYLSGQIRQPS